MPNITGLLALADGSLFWGQAFGAGGTTVGEVIFNTSITGYQEIITDPSYAKQIVTLTHPHIGNVGTNATDVESSVIHTSALVVRSLPRQVSNWRSQEPLPEFLRRCGIIGLEGIDTRELTRLIRSRGAQNGCIVSGDDIDSGEAVRMARGFEGLQGMDLAKVVTTAEPYQWSHGASGLGPVEPGASSTSASAAKRSYSVIAYDYGVKHNILRMLVERGCEITVVPAQTPLAELEGMRIDGVFLSNGPGDPEPCAYAIQSIRQLLERKTPVFGICLGHQLLALASGAKTVKMKFGHHGANHPVKDLRSGEILITSQNHGFAVDGEGLPDCLEVTHRSLFDDSIQGLRHRSCPAFSFQGHPEASPGPHEAGDMFDRFIDLMSGRAP